MLQWLSTMAYQPWKVYLVCTLLLLLSSFGLPVPEEVTLVSAGLVAFVGRSPEHFPPPSPGAPVVDAAVLAVVCTAAVFLSDLLIYGMGRRFGPRLRQTWLARRLISRKSWARAEKWTERHGGQVCWVFRFTPGVRFPGHLTCGIVKLPLWQFCLADGIATLVSVPSQILLVAHYGGAVLGFLKQFKVALAVALVAVVVGALLVRFLRRRRASGADEGAGEPDPGPVETPP